MNLGGLKNLACSHFSLVPPPISLFLVRSQAHALLELGEEALVALGDQEGALKVWHEQMFKSIAQATHQVGDV